MASEDDMKCDEQPKTARESPSQIHRSADGASEQRDIADTEPANNEQESGSSPNDENYQGPHNWRKRLKPIHSPILEDIGFPGETPSGDGNQRSTEQSKVIRRRSSKEDRSEENKSREKYRSKRDAGRKAALVSGSSSPGCIKRRNSFNNHLDSPFTRQVVKQAVSPGLQRRKGTGSTGNVSKIQVTERKNSLVLPLNTSRRATSPNMIGDGSAAAATDARKRVDKVMKARLYLLQQLGPNSFLIGGDSPDHKFKIIIGPQRCNCGRGPHCVHILFVMLRVFQISENDPCLWSKTLKNYEVEALFKNFHARRTSRIHELMRKKSKPVLQKPSEEQCLNHEDVQNTNHEESEVADKVEEEETCPICLLEMVEGESLVQCENGCQNKLHHHCIDVWFEECRRQNEPLNCPLCRAKWKKQDVSSESLQPTGEDLPVPPNTRASSPQTLAQEQDLPMPPSEPVPPEHAETASHWIPVIGEEITSCLFSHNWVIREIALQQLSRAAVGALLLGVGEGRSGVVLSPTRQATTQSMLECCCDVLAFICADPVYKVFVAALRTLRTVLSYTPCRDEAQQQRLQTMMTPVVHTILWKCADSNRRTSQLSISALQELAKGQDGELALGKEIVNPGQKGLGGLEFLLNCIVEKNSEELQWQHILGRLYMLDRLLEECVSEFTVQNNDQSEATILDEAKNYDKVFSVLSFCVSQMGHNHAKVNKMARRVFFLLAKLQAQSRAVMKDISDLLDDVDINIQARMRRKLWRLADEYSTCQNEKSEDQESGIMPFGPEGLMPPYSTPLVSAASTPRSASPLTIDGTIAPSHTNIMMHNLMVGQFVGGSTAPPNSPNQKIRQRASNSTSSNPATCDNDSVFSADDSTKPLIFSPEALGKMHPSVYRPPPQGQSPLDLEKSPRIHERLPCVEVADACVATSPRLRTRGLHRCLVLGTASQSEEDYGNEEDDESGLENDDDEVGVDALDEVGAKQDKDCCSQVMPNTAKPLVFTDGPVYDDSDTLPENVEVGHKRKSKTSKVKRKQRLSDERSRIVLDPSHLDGADEQLNAEEQENEPASDCDLLTRNEVDDTKQCEGNITVQKQSSNTETQTLDMKEDAGTQTDDDELSSANATINTTHGALFTEDLSDLTLSHSGDDKVTFKDEVARASPKHSGHGTEVCPCKEEVEKEEAKALVEALEKSTIAQDELPRVPGLSRIHSTHTLTIHIQDQENGSDTGEYKEDIHWKRGCVLGTGAFSTCYQARDVKTGTLMAVKQISYCRNSEAEQEKVVEAVREEIMMMAKLNHPNIVRILGATQQDCHFFMFVEWMPGGSVAYLLDRYGIFTEQVQTSYTFQVLRGLAYLHENHILHRDLKGANLLVDSTGQRVRIGDFGASARLATRQTGAGEFQGQLLGTIAFMAPEVLRGESYGRSCDIWSVGCVMIEMATGKPPWGAHDISNHLALIFKIASASNPPPIPENITPAVKDLMLRCLEPNREERPPAKELLKHPLFTMYTKR